MSFSKYGLAIGARQSLPLAISAALYGVVFGILARQSGLSVLDATLMSGIVCAGASQFMVLDLWQSPLSALRIVLTAFLVNLRHVLMGLTLQPFLATLRTVQRYGSAFFLSDESWALTMRAATTGFRDGAYLLGAGLTMWIAWVGATAAGSLLGSSVQNPAKWGLDFAFAAVLLALLTGMRNGKASIRPALITIVIALAAAHWLPGKWYILIGGIGGSLFGGDRNDR